MSEETKKPGLDAVDMMIDPIWWPVSKATPLDTQNLYKNPGRFFAVDGPVVEDKP